MIRIVLICLLLPALAYSAPTGAKYFDFNAGCQDAYQKTVSLRLTEARVALDQLKRTESGNLIPYFIDNYLDFLTVFTNDDPAELNRLAKNMDGRLSKMGSGDSKSPYYLFSQAQIRLQWAILRLRNGDWVTGASDIKQAYALLEENKRKFPDFAANDIPLGMLHAVVGAVPDEYKWLVKVIGGMNGDIPLGIRELENAVAYGRTHAFPFAQEAVMTCALVHLYLNNNPDKGLALMKEAGIQPKESPLGALVLSLIALRSGHNDDAIRVLSEKPSGANYQPFYHLDYLLGLAKLRRLDYDANKPLETYLNHHKGQNGIKEGYQKLAWFHWISENENGYNLYMNYAKLKGAANAEGDKAALREAKSGQTPDLRLLKARLLFDGGYYAKAYNLLATAEQSYAGEARFYLEYQYRMGRITHQLGKIKEARRYYNRTIELGSDQPWFYACNAALQLGLIQEAAGEYAGARTSFNRCLAINPQEYGPSMHALAKAGLNRIKGKS